MPVSDDYDVAIGGLAGGLSDDGLVEVIANILNQSIQAFGDILGTPRSRLVFQVLRKLRPLV
jgi:hypothetical protein